jgi:FkbM family methyltransferase
MNQGPVTAEHVRWAYRLLLDREPESEAAVSGHLSGSASTRALRQNLLTSAEFRAMNPTDLFYTSGSAVVLKILPNGLRLFLDLSDLAIGLNIARDSYEPSETAFVEANVARGATAIDVGANIGYFALTMANCAGPTGRIYAYEPFDQNTKLFERSLEENGLAQRILLRKILLGDHRGEADLVVLPLENNSFNSGGSFILPAGAPVPPGHQLRRIEMTTLDDEDIPSRVSFIKIDVEGAEPFVFRGARRLLREHRPLILSEINPPALQRVAGVSVSDFLREMSELGFDALALDGAALGRPFQPTNSVKATTVVFRPRNSDHS